MAGIVEKVDRFVGKRLDDIRGFIATLYAGQLHANRIDSLVRATLGIMTGASLAVTVIGQALAQARGLVTEHATKQVDRLLSNQGIDGWDSFAHWVPHMIGARKQIVVAMHAPAEAKQRRGDWTDFDGDGQSTLALNMVSCHGRATPLIWLTVWKDELTERRNDYEDTCLAKLRALIPAECHVTLLADRGFGDHELFNYLDELGFSYVLRFRGNIHVTDATGETRAAKDWVGKGGRAHKLRGAKVTASHAFPVVAVVCVHAPAMKEPRCLAASDGTASATTMTKYYAKRVTIEPHFRDTKDLRVGMGLSATRIGEPTRRDRQLLVNAFAIALPTMLGAAGEAQGMDRLFPSRPDKT